jgi:hypothetical protein
MKGKHKACAVQMGEAVYLLLEAVPRSGTMVLVVDRKWRMILLRLASRWSKSESRNESRKSECGNDWLWN